MAEQAPPKTKYQKFLEKRDSLELWLHAIVGMQRIGPGGEYEITADKNYDYLTVVWHAVYEDGGGYIGIYDAAWATCSKEKANDAMNTIGMEIVEKDFPIPNKGLIFEITFETGHILTDKYGNETYERIKDYSYDRIGISSKEFSKIHYVDEDQDGEIDMTYANFFDLSDLFKPHRDNFPSKVACQDI